MRRTRRTLSAVLALALLLGCMGWTPTRAEEATLETSPGTVTENIQAQDSAEGMDILQQEEARGKEHIARLTHEENLNQHIFLNRDGSKTMYLYDHPVKYRDADGKMQDISLEIAQTQDARYPYRTKANSAVTSFPADMADGIRLEGEGVSIRLAAQMPVGSATGTTTLVNQRARRVDAETVAYTYDAKTSIEYSLTYTGFKEDIVVSQYTGQTEYNFILYTNGLTLTELGGSYYLTDAEGEIRASIGEIIVFTADERNNTMGQLQAVTVKENQIYGMTIVLDADYLADPDTVYPIRIDPTVQIHYSTAASTAIEDVTIQSGNVSYPEMTTLGIGLRSYGISRVLMRFPGIDFSDYEGVEITEATIVLRDVQCESTYMPVYCYPFTGSDWTESTASWASLTQSWGAELDCQTISYYNGVNNDPAHYYYFDIADVVQDWVDGTADPDKGIIFKASDAVENGTTMESRVFASYERDSYRPIFTMVYNNAVSITPVEAEVYVGETVSLTAVTAPANLAVTWASLNDEIATVNASGVVTGIAPGTAIITAELEDGASASCVVTVLAKSITLNPTSLEMYVGQEKTITATTQPAGEDVDWQSENSAVATVANGVVTGVSVGSTRIVAELDDGTIAYCAVTVSTKSITLNKDSLVLQLDQSETVIANTLPNGEAVSWSSNNPAVASVDSNGRITAMGIGEATISAQLLNGVRATCLVTVKCAGTLNHTSINVVEGNIAVLSLSTSSYMPITWTSSDENIAVVSSSGFVTGIRPGVVEITADGPYLLYPVTCIVTVRLSEAIYSIQNKGNQRCIAVFSSGISEDSEVVLNAYNTENTANAAAFFAQRWKICYLNNGYYSIRPAHKLNLGLYMASDLNIAVRDIGTSDDGYVPTNAQWSITATGSGYVIKNRLYPNYAITYSSGITAAVISNSLSATQYTWNIIKEEITPQILLYDAVTGKYIEEARRGMTPEDVFTQDELKIIVSVVSNTEVDFSVLWVSDNPSAARVNARTGVVTGIAYGITTITAVTGVGGEMLPASYTLVVSEIPITGYELEYDPDLWNKTEVASGKYIRHYTNCYAYAINNQIDPIQNSFGCNSDSYQVKQQPGEFYSDNNTNGDALGLQNWLGNFVGEKIINAVHKDFEIHNTLLGTNLQFLDASGNVPLGGYKVYLAIKPMGLFVSSDYHWYRQNPDGTWSHKQGTQPVTNKDKNGNIIWNPKAAAELAGYTEEVGYFIVTPWNNLYEPISAAQLESNTDIASACTAATNAIVWTNSVEVGMSIDDVIELLGYAGEDIGSGTVIHKYATTQGRNVIISYIMDSDGVFRVVGIYHQ